jgi:hypothetical protein
MPAHVVVVTIGYAMTERLPRQAEVATMREEDLGTIAPTVRSGLGEASEGSVAH